jgi:hypothetical protein
MLFGKHRQVWNRDIDRLAPRWIINRLSQQTGTPLTDAHGTTLSAYRTILYPRRRDSGILQWILPLEIWHRKRTGHGLQYCPVCLAEDEIPYFRKRWRVALYTFCTRHNVMVQDRCPVCQSGVVFHRLEQGQYGSADESPLSICHECGFDLRDAPAVAPRFYEASSQQILLDTLRMLEGGDLKRFDGGFFNVFHHLSKIILSNTSHIRLHEYLVSQVGAFRDALSLDMKCIEEYGIYERHHTIQLGMWLLADLQNRLVGAWRAKVVRYNVLKRDFKKMPEWYRDVLTLCIDWRNIK